MSHAELLRDHWQEDAVVSLVQVLDAAASHATTLPQIEGLAHVLAQLDGLHGLEPGDTEVLAWVCRATLAPRTLTRAHLAPLRAAGLTDRALHDIAHVCACFGYMNRLADMLGVTLLDNRAAFAERLFGIERCTAHTAWGGHE